MKRNRCIIFLTLLAVLSFSGCDFKFSSGGNTSVPDISDSSASETQQSVSQDVFYEEENEINTFTDEQLLTLAREKYTMACLMTEKYLSGTAYVTDKSRTIDRGGETAYLVTDSMVASIDDIMNEWLIDFSSKYVALYNDMFSCYFQDGDDIWVIPQSYDVNETYLDTVISEVVERTDDEITFSAVSRYKKSDGTEKKVELPFSIVYSANIFKIGKFSMPY